MVKSEGSCVRAQALASASGSTSRRLSTRSGHDSGSIFGEIIDMAPGLQGGAEEEEKLKASLVYSVGETIDAISLTDTCNATPQFILGLSEILAAQIETISGDLEAFAKHAGRSTINTKDVLLLARRNDALDGVLKQESERTEKRRTHEAR